MNACCRTAREVHTVTLAVLGVDHGTTISVHKSGVPHLLLIRSRLPPPKYQHLLPRKRQYRCQSSAEMSLRLLPPKRIHPSGVLRVFERSGSTRATQ